MQDNIPDALIAAFERHYDCSWDTSALRNERLAWRAAWAEATKPCLHQIQEPAAAPAAVAVLDALREAEAALEVAIARILKASPGHSISVTSEAKALVAVRAALAATPADHIADAGKMVAAPAGWKLVPVQVPDSAFPWVSGGYNTDYRAHDPRDQKIIEDRAQRTWEAILDGIAATPAAAPKANAGAVIAAPVELLERVIDSLSSFAGNKPHTEVDMTIWEQLNDLLSAAPPAGWKLVPMEPTAEMLESAGATDRDGTPATYKTLYMAMVGAALNPPPACDTPRYCNSVQRCTAMDEQRAAAAPVVLPEPDVAISEVMGLVSDWGMKEHLSGEAQLDACGQEATPVDEDRAKQCWVEERAAWQAIESKLRALLAQAATAAAPQAQADARDAVLAHLDGLLDDAAAHIYPSDLRKCQTGECTVTVASVRMGNRNERSVPLYSREQVAEAFDAAQAAQGDE